MAPIIARVGGEHTGKRFAGLAARVSALEADRVDHRAMMGAITAIGETQREHSDKLREHDQRFERIDAKLDEHTARFRSLEEGVAEIKDLIVRAFDKP